MFLMFSALACRARQVPTTGEPTPTPSAPRVVPLSRVIILETSGPPPADTSVSFTAGSERTIVMYHGGENITFARLIFGPGAFADSGRTVEVEVRPRPGIYGLDLTTSLPLRENQATVVFEYSRYFSAPARAREVYGGDEAYERALAVGRLLPDGQVELLPSIRPAVDNLRAGMTSAGRYMVGSAQ